MRLESIFFQGTKREAGVLPMWPVQRTLQKPASPESLISDLAPSCARCGGATVKVACQE